MLMRQILVSAFHAAPLSTEVSVFVVKLEAAGGVQEVSLASSHFLYFSQSILLHITVKDNTLM